jgi:D-alanyl-D-alanine carboxypeptidase
MKQFFSILFGGLCAIGIGVGIAYGGARLWDFARNNIEPLHISIRIPSLADLAAAITPDVHDGTTISGLSRTIRYTAVEEEDLINAAAQSITPDPSGEITAPVYLVSNLTTDRSVTARNEEKIVPIASITKLVTAVVARRNIEPTDRITIGRNVMSAYGNTAQFKVGETFEARDLYYPLLMVSSNDAAAAFALAYGYPEFIVLMNEFAQSIGAYRTYFVDPSGISPQNISTARDLALIIDWIRKNEPDILAITTEKSRTVRAHTWVNPTHFLNWSTYAGGKNGYIPEANRTSVSLFQLGTRNDIYAVIVLGSELRDRDVVTLLEKTGR